MAGPSAGACVALIGVLMFNFNAAIKTGESCVNIKPGLAGRRETRICISLRAQPAVKNPLPSARADHAARRAAPVIIGDPRLIAYRPRIHVSIMASV